MKTDTFSIWMRICKFEEFIGKTLIGMKVQSQYPRQCGASVSGD